MPTIFTHAIAGAALAQVLAPGAHRRALTGAAAFAAMLPDADVAGFAFGVSYGDMFGHRGFTHSLFFAAVAGAASGLWRTRSRMRTGIFIALAMASHGVLDAFTNGGRGVAFLAPFDATRYFFPVTPIDVSPLGLGFFSQRGLTVLRSEFLWVWIPSLAVIGGAIGFRKLLGPKRLGA